MTRFGVVFRVIPAVKMQFNVDFTVNVGSSTVQMLAKDLLQKDKNGVPYPVGVQVEVRMDGDNRDQVVQLAQGWANALVSALSFASNVGIGEVRPVTMCDIDEGQPVREFMQYYYNLPVPPASIGEVYHVDFQNVFGRLAEGSVKYLDRIVRAVSWYNKGLRETNVIDQFVSNWVGLETLNEPLKEVLAVPDDTEACSNCGHVRKLSTMVGIRTFTKANVVGGATMYKRARNLRVAIMHSTRNLSEVLKEAGTLAPYIQFVLRKAIVYLLDVDSTNLLAKYPLPNNVPFHTSLLARIVGANAVDKLRIGEDYPSLNLTSFSVDAEVQTDKSVNMTPKIAYTAFGPNDPAKFEVYGSRLYYEAGSISKVKFGGATKN